MQLFHSKERGSLYFRTQLFILSVFFLTLICLYQRVAFSGADYAWFSHPTIYQYFTRILILVGAPILFFLLLREQVWKRFASRLEKFFLNRSLPILLLVGCNVVILVFWMFRSSFESNLFIYIPPFWVTSILVFSSIYLFSGIGSENSTRNATIYLISLILFRLLFIQLKQITNYPFSLSFSEGSWIYQASQLLMGNENGLPLLDPLRIFLLAIPVALSKKILVIRLISLIVSFLIYGLTSYALVKRLAFRSRFDTATLFCLSLIVLLVCPVYPYTLIGPVIILLGFKPQKKLQSLILLAVASLIEGFSRINWFPIPAILAVLIFFLEDSTLELKNWKTWIQPVLYVAVGGVFSVGAYYLYISYAHLPVMYLNPEYQYMYIPRRLLPNHYFIPGTLPGSLLLLAPLWVYVGVGAIRNKAGILRVLLISGTLLMTYLIGMVISMRIGGGFDIHNFDIVFFISLFIFLKFYKDGISFPSGEKNRSLQIGRGLVMTALVCVFCFLEVTKPFSKPAFIVEDSILPEIQLLLDENPADSPVLLLSQQQLTLTQALQIDHPSYDFDYVYLTEMLMANNPAEPEAFLRAIKNDAYSLVIGPVLSPNFKSSDEDAFSEENNIWAPYANEFLKYYSPILEFRDTGIAVYAPMQ